MRHMLIGLGALSLLAVSPARAQDPKSNDKMEQKSETKTNDDGTKTEKHSEAKHTMDGADGKVVDSGSTDMKMKTNDDGSTDKVKTSEKMHKEKGAKGRRKVTHKVSKDASGNVTHEETDVKQK